MKKSGKKPLNHTEEGDNEGAPVCERCGNAKIQEEGLWVCPHCQGEIDFFGEDEESD